MHRFSYFVMILSMAIMGEAAYDYCKKCNKSFEILKNSQYPSYPRLRQMQAYLSEEDYNEESEQKQSSYDRENRNLMPEYRSLCEVVTKIVQLDDSEYEYQPPHYHEVYCKSYSLLNTLQQNPTRQKCVHPPDFHCVQRSKSIVLVRRRWDSECWEPYIKQIASGCDCMWPVSIFGEIAEHY